MNKQIEADLKEIRFAVLNTTTSVREPARTALDRIERELTKPRVVEFRGSVTSDSVAFYTARMSDGTMWRRWNNKDWQQLPPIPEGD